MGPDPELYPWLSAAALAWGLLDCFCGYKVFKVTVALIGALLGGLFGHAAGLALGFGAGGALGAAILGALLGGGLAFLCFLAAVFLAGFGFGAALGLLLLANYHHVVALAAGILLGLIGGYAAVKLQRPLLILSTALLGAFRAVLALGYFTGRLDWVYYHRHPEQLPALIDGNGWLFPAILVLAAFGAVTQFGLTPGSAEPAKKPKAKKD